MDSILFGLSFVLIFSFWAWDAYKLMRLWGDIEDAKNWPSATARLVGITPSLRVNDKSKSNIFYRFVKFLVGKKSYNVFAKMQYKDVEIGVYKVSLYRKFNRHCFVFCKQLERSELEEIDVYYNPDVPHEVILMPPSSHKIMGSCLWLGIKTFALTVLILYLFV